MQPSRKPYDPTGAPRPAQLRSMMRRPPVPALGQPRRSPVAPALGQPSQSPNVLFQRAAARAANQLSAGGQITAKTLARLRSGQRGGKGIKFSIGPAQLDAPLQERISFLRTLAQGR